MADKLPHFPYLSHEEFSKLSQPEKIVYLKIAVFELSRELGPREIFKPIIAPPPGIAAFSGHHAGSEHPFQLQPAVTIGPR